MFSRFPWARLYGRFFQCVEISTYKYGYLTPETSFIVILDLGEETF